MKKAIIITIVAIVVASCGVIQLPKGETVSFLDYRPYTEAGIFISPYNYTGKYEAIGQLDIIIYPDSISDGLSTTLIEIPSKELLDRIVKHSIGKGANGIANLKISRIVNTTVTRFGSYSSLSHYEISGFLIRIED